ncbi:MAG TPA: hypothetical protein VHC43_17545 [Mycobacteriales bacterium]|nr:hypothetical protein [Mycobacteriales bacterium]
MIRRVTTLVIAVLMAALTTAAPAFAGSGNSGGATVHIDGDVYCC